VIGIIVGVIAIVGAIAAAVRWWLRRRRREPPGVEQTVVAFSDVGKWGLGAEFESSEPETPRQERAHTLVARSIMAAAGFKDRDRELERIGQLVDQGREVMWVTGPAQAGKSWLISRHVKDRGLEGKAARFELRGGADVQGLLEGVNAFLRDKGEDRFDSWCRSPGLDLKSRTAALCKVLHLGQWVLVLDSFEDVADEREWRELVEMMQQDVQCSVVFVGSRVMPEWGDVKAEVAVGPIEEGAGKELLVEAGVPQSAAKELYNAVGGLPGALEHAGALARKRTVSEVVQDVKGAAESAGEALLSETFEQASESARQLWTALCLLPASVTREAGRAICEDEKFDAAWDELVEWKLLEPGEHRAELHPLARAVGEKRLEGIEQWAKTCGERIAGYYAEFAKKTKERAAVEAELENVLAAARLAFEYREWEALWGMGYALWQPLRGNGAWTAHAELLMLCYEAAKQTEHEQRYGDFAHNLAMVFLDRWDFSEAERLFSISLGVWRSRGQRPEEAATLHELGNIALLRRRSDEAENWYTKSLAIKRDVGDRRGEAQTLHQLGIVEQERRHLPQAEGLYRRSLAIEREVGDRPGEAETLHQLGLVALACGILDEAERYFTGSLTIKREVGDRPGEARTIWAMARLAEAKGDLNLAIKRSEKAVAMLEEMGAGARDEAREDLERLRKRPKRHGTSQKWE
jgi:tetratricopeptide (TPR) repeat protein